MDVPKRSRKIFKWNIFLYFSAIAANLATFSLGSIFAWSSPAIPRLNGQIDPENNPLSQIITPYEESWIASLVPLGSAISSFLSGYLSDRIGRKYTLLASSIPTILGFLCLTFATKIWHFYIGRFLCGLGCGTVFTIIPIYIGEIAQSNNRGTLGCFFTFFISSGNMFIYLLCPYVTLKTLSAIILIIPVIFLLIFGIFIPESPYYYVTKGKINMAAKSLLKFRFNNVEMVEEELPIIVKNVEESFANKVSFKDIYRDKVLMRAFSITIGLLFFQQWSGINVVFFYMQSIFEETGSKISSDTCVIIAGVLQLLASACTLPTVDRFGRKILLLISATGNALTLFTTGIYFHLKENTEIQIDKFNWIPVLTINLFIVFYTLGFGPISFTMIGELFPPYIRSLAATLNIFACLSFIFGITNLFPYLKESVGLGASFCVLGVICCISGIFVYAKVLETKGKSLEEIQELLRM